jgi:hypothetical protein
VNEWYDTDSLQLSDWINTLPRGPDKDIAIERLIVRVKTSDRATALELAGQIQDASLRARVQGGLGIERK